MTNDNSSKHLYLLWTSDNYETAEKMVFMYAINSLSQGWWENVTLIIWGASVKLASQNKNIQKLIMTAQEAGVHISACKACAKQSNSVEALENLNIEIIYWGSPLTDILKNKETLLTI